MRYRPEIDGLRAVAVLPVVLFHAGFSTFSGGFVGVDVFFVLSGYLITTLILEEMNEGQFSLSSFYVRRMRRILPALFLVAAVCFVVALFIIPPGDMLGLSSAMIWMTLFTSNIYFWLHTGYFEASSQLNPLLHTWTLAVEEQFYIFFPLALIALRKLPRCMVFVILAVFIAASLCLAQWQSSYAPAAAFYLLPSRAWELLIGSLTALYLASNCPRLSGSMATLGLFLVVLPVFLFTESIPYPSIYTMVPAIGTVLLILFCNPSSSVGRILSHPSVVMIGLISYSLYLWHHPIFAFYRIIFGGGQIPLLPAVVLIIAALLISYLTWRHVEQPCRSITGQRRVFAFAAIAAMLTLIIGASGFFTEGFRFRFTKEQQDFLAFFENSRPEQAYFRKIRFREQFRDECNFYDIESDTNGRSTRVPRPSIAIHCFTKSSPTKKSVFIWGDSHARQLSLGILQNISSDWDVLQVTSHGCLASTSATASKIDYCEYSNWFAYQAIKRERPEVVVIGQNLQHDVKKMSELGAALHEAGVKRVIFTGPSPHWIRYLPKIVAFDILPDRRKKTKSGLNQSVIHQDNALKRNFRAVGDMEYFSLIDRMCDSSGCNIFLGDDMQRGITSFDDAHLTPVASSMIGPDIVRAITAPFK